MSFFRCCVGGDRDPPTQSGPRAGTVGAARAKASKPAEVFFDVPKADPQLSAVTDPPASAAGAKRSKDSREKGRSSEHARDGARKLEQSELDLPDNNGLSRGQNFAKVEKWLHASAEHEQVPIAPASPIVNLEDPPPAMPASTSPRGSDANARR